MHDCKPKFTPVDDLLNENDPTKCDKPFREAVGALFIYPISHVLSLCQCSSMNLVFFDHCIIPMIRR